MSINIENNIKFEIWAWLNASLSSNLLLIKWWKETLFSLLDFPFSLTLIKFDSNWLAIQREIVSVTWLAWNVLTITRAFEACPINDSALELSQEPYLFDEWDFAFLTLTAQDLKNIYLAIADKLDSDWGLRIWMIANSIAYFDENWDETLLEYDPVTDLWKSLVISWTWLSLQSPSVNINWLDEKTWPIANDYFIISDSEDSNVNKKLLYDNFFSKSYWSWDDWNVIISTNTTLTRDMEYDNLTINNWITLYTNWFKVLVANTFTNNWNITLNWWNGGNWWNAWWTTDRWTTYWGNWWGGWFWWNFYLIWDCLSLWTITNNWWLWWSWWRWGNVVWSAWVTWVVWIKVINFLYI